MHLISTHHLTEATAPAARFWINGSDRSVGFGRPRPAQELAVAPCKALWLVDISSRWVHPSFEMPLAALLHDDRFAARITRALTHPMGSTVGSQPTELRWAWANLFSLLLLSLSMFLLQAPVTFYRYDGTLILTLVKNQAEWMPGFEAFTMDFMKGNGGLWLPYQTRSMPGFVVGLLGGVGDWLPALAATWFAAEFAIATVIVARTLGLSLSVGTLAAWLGVLGALPYTLPAPALDRFWGNPHFLTMSSGTMLALCCFLQIGRGSKFKAVAYAGALMALLCYLTIIMPALMIVVLPVLGFFGLVALSMATDRRERSIKLVAGVGLGVTYLALHGVYLAGLLLFAKTTFFWSEVWSVPVNWHWGSFLVENPDRHAGLLLLLVAALGAAITAWTGNTSLRRFSIGYLTFVTLTWTVTAVVTVTGVEWRGPSVSYFDLCIYPLHCLFAALFVWRCLSALSARVIGRPAAAMMIMLILPWSVLAAWSPPYDKPLLKNQVPFRWPPSRTPVVDFLEEHIALRPGAPFRGRTVNLAGAGWDPAYVHVPFVNQHDYDAMVLTFVGNEHRQYGLWYYNIPTLEEVSHTNSPFFYLVLSRLLNPPGVLFPRPHVSATLFKPSILEQLGVRYALTEEPVSGRVPVLTMEVDPRHSQYLYELPNPNVGGRSATKITVAADAADAIARLAAPDMDFTREVVLFDALPAGPLLQATESRLEVHAGFLALQAQAPGRSLLVLPVEFSRCLDFHWNSPGAEPPRVYRANLDQTAILFSGRIDVRIALRIGPYSNPFCRYRDYQDALQVNLQGARTALER
jgi:hypothetical protein